MPLRRPYRIDWLTEGLKGTQVDTKWKDLVLRSGLPLEYEVKAYLDKKGFVPSYEAAYLREDEAGRTRSFSYDIRATILRPRHQIELMVECKYRHESVKWFFLPEEYGGVGGLEALDVFHPVDEFTEEASPFSLGDLFPELAPAAGRGIELTKDQTNGKSIYQATTQLAYAFAEHLTEAIVCEIDRLLGKDTVLCNLPVIVTTAHLYRLNEGITIAAVKGASEPKDIATQCGLLVLRQPEDPEIYGRNLEALQQLVSERGADLQKKMRWHNNDLDHLLEVLSRRPKAYAVVQFTEDRSNFERLFRYTDDCLNPKSSLWAEWHKRQDEVRSLAERLRQRKPPNSGSRGRA